jgi:glutamine synthetase
VLREYVVASKKIRFEGNGYSDEWVKEAEKRGLSNVKTTAHALDFWVTPTAEKLFDKYQIYSKKELHARYEIMNENYIKKIQIEGRVIGDLATNHIIPTAIAYQNKLISNVKGLKDLGLEAESKPVIELIKEMSKHISTIQKGVDDMTEERKKANKIEDTSKGSKAYCDKVKPHFENIRYAVDKLELIVGDEDWPLPKYREMLFLR